MIIDACSIDRVEYKIVRSKTVIIFSLFSVHCKSGIRLIYTHRHSSARFVEHVRSGGKSCACEWQSGNRVGPDFWHEKAIRKKKKKKKVSAAFIVYKLPNLVPTILFLKTFY